MKCPNCQETLLMTHRNNVEIDYCPQCRGVWLDRGELDKIIAQNESQSLANDDQRQSYDQGTHDQNRDRHDQNRDRHNPRKKRSFLGDFFDFD